MPRRILLLLLIVSAAPLFATSLVKLTVTPGSPAAPGSNFTWMLTLENDSADYLNPTIVESTFPFPPMTFDFTDLYNHFPNGLGSGQSTNFQVGYPIPVDAVPGSQIGNLNGPCCVIEVGYDLYADAAGLIYDGSFTVSSPFVSIEVATIPSAPEPTTTLFMVMGLPLVAVLHRRRSIRKNEPNL